jgi:5-methylcytosine-specific restriction endonuclease McrA
VRTLTRRNRSPTARKVRLHIGHIKDKNLGGKDELSNLRALCSTCNQGAKNITGEKPSAIRLLSQIRRAWLDEQKAAYDWLAKKFSKPN